MPVVASAVVLLVAYSVAELPAVASVAGLLAAYSVAVLPVAASAVALLAVSSVVEPPVARAGQAQRAAAALNAERAEVLDFLPEALHAFSVEQVQVPGLVVDAQLRELAFFAQVLLLWVLPAAESAGGLPCHGAGNGIAGYVAYFAVPPLDSGRL